MSSLDTTNELQQLLEAVANQKVSVTEATKQLAHAQTIDDLGFAKVDLSRQKRNGYPEVIYGAGKTAKIFYVREFPQKSTLRFKKRNRQQCTMKWRNV